LAYLIVGDEALDILRWILKNLRIKVHSEMAHKKNVSMESWTTGAMSFWAISQVIPPLAVVGGAVGLVGMAGEFIMASSRSYDRRRKIACRDSMDVLEGQFPQLIQLHEPIAEAWRHISSVN
jgi:hypothetical protein